MERGRRSGDDVLEERSITLAYKKLRRKSSVFNRSEIDGVTCFVQTGRGAEKSYDIASRLQSQFLLRPILKKKVDETTYYFYEQFDNTLNGWILNEKNEIITTSGEPTKGFLQILRDILRGLQVLAVDKQEHGNLTVKDVVIKEGRAKLVNISNDRLVEDRIAFANLVRWILETKSVQFRTKHLDDLVTFLLGDDSSRKRLLSIARHPIFLGPRGKLFYRLSAHDVLDYESWNGATLHTDMPTLMDRRSWTQHVPNRGRFHAIKARTQNVSDDVRSFLRYGRNVVAHANEDATKRRQEAILNADPNMWIEDSEEVVAANLEDIWPRFLNSIHRIYTMYSITIPVDDRWLE